MSFLMLAGRWLLAFTFLAAAVSSGARALRMSMHRGDWPLPERRGAWSACWAWLAVAVVTFTVLGLLTVLRAALLTAVLAGAAAGLELRSGRDGFAGRLARDMLRGLGGLRSHAAGGWQSVAGKLREDAPETPTGTAAPAAVVSSDDPALRDVPSFRDDPALGDAPAPQEVATLAEGVPVPEPWIALCQYVAGFEPDDHVSLAAHMAGEAQGFLALVEAVRARADGLLHGAGLDPAYIGGHAEYADELAEMAAAVVMVERRFAVIYGETIEAVDSGMVLPFNARQFFGGSGGQAA